MGHPPNRTAILFALVTVALGPLFAVAVTEAGTSPPQNPLHQEIGGYKNGESDFFSALQEVSYKYGVPLGVETDAQGQSTKHISVSVSQGTVADIFNALIQQAPNDRWVESSGVVNVLPRQHADSLLDLSIAGFYVTQATPDGLCAAIRTLPEVEAWLNQHHLVERSFVTSSILIGRDGKTDQPRVSLRLKAMTLREIMNTIVKKPGFRVWFVGRYGDHGQYVNLSID
jgi:hypothetical protein